MIQIQNYIDGTFVNPIKNEWIDNIDPSVGSVYGTIPNSNSEDVQIAYEAAQRAFNTWSETSIEKRSSILLKIARLI